MITEAVCNAFKTEILQRQQDDVFKIALYKSAASLSKNTPAYTPTNEASGDGYIAGGQALEGFSVVLIGDVAVLDWTVDPVWTPSSISARGALIYNASRGNVAVRVLDFGQTITSTNGPFTVILPAPTVADALMRVK